MSHNFEIINNFGDKECDTCGYNLRYNEDYKSYTISYYSLGIMQEYLYAHNKTLVQVKDCIENISCSQFIKMKNYIYNYIKNLHGHKIAFNNTGAYCTVCNSFLKIICHFHSLRGYLYIENFNIIIEGYITDSDECMHCDSILMRIALE